MRLYRLPFTVYERIGINSSELQNFGPSNSDERFCIYLSCAYAELAVYWLTNGSHFFQTNRNLLFQPILYVRAIIS